MVPNFQKEATWRVQHSAEDERAEDEDGSEAGAVCLHLQMSPGRDQKPRGGWRLLWPLSHWYCDKIITVPYQVSFTKTSAICQFIAHDTENEIKVLAVEKCWKQSVFFICSFCVKVKVKHLLKSKGIWNDIV